MNCILSQKLAVLLAFLFPIIGYSQLDKPASPRLEKIYSSKSKEEINVLLSSWGLLSPLERRFLLAETRGRLSKDERNSDTKNQWSNVRVERRYGSAEASQGVNRFLIQTRVRKKFEDGPQSSSSLSKFETLLQNRANKLNVVNRGNHLAPSGTLEVRRAAYGLGFDRRLLDGEFAGKRERTKNHKRYDQQSEVR